MIHVTAGKRIQNFLYLRTQKTKKWRYHSAEQPPCDPFLVEPAFWFTYRGGTENGRLPLFTKTYTGLLRAGENWIL